MKTRSLILKSLLAVGIILVLMQFIRPTKNLSGDNTYAISTKYNVPPEVSALLEGACFDCHSNTTKYPWYAEIQPAAWWLANHVNEGKEHLNFSEFTNKKIAYQNHKLDEVVEMVEEKEMPLPSYTWMGLHPEANLTDQERGTITLWAQSLMAQLAAKYPADSLVRK